ncbi:elongation factor G [Salinibacter sp. 10B]|uniref:elongation factor G n=1 Tax=Salinibacter sp. 10B TaxID=1923971 RepID=UPI000CF43F71|nr:elongation factor G [Salinibacter sp. 10B]PQJ36016.1 elongation factor G [Salinibacter sp. 10B]
MTVSSPTDLRNVALVGHQGSGKTALAEAMLYTSGEIGRPGSVNEGTTQSDYHPSEKDRQMSIFTSLLHAEWHGDKINILDTPGYPDFASEVIAAMKVADTALYVMDARSGVEVGTEMAWTYGEQEETPSLFVVNHIDQQASDFRTIVDEIEDRFGRGATVVQIPAGEGTRSLIDVLRMQQLYYPENSSEPEVQPIDEAFAEEANELHETLVEDIAANDEALMETYFEQGKLTEAQMRDGLRAAMLERELFPVFVTSATEVIGVSRLMSFIDNVCPSPADRPVQTENGDTLIADADDETVGFVYRTMAQEHVGEYSYVRAYDGTLESGSDLENAETGATERIGQIYVLNGEDRQNVPRLVAGDLGALVKLDDTNTNDTLRESGSDVVIPPIQFPRPRYTMAVEATETGKEDKLAQGLHQITAEDPSLVYDHDPILNQLTLSGQGELHLQIAKSRLQRRAGVEVTFSTPRVSYREAIKNRATADYRHKKQSGGAGEFADISMLVEPLDGDFHPPDFVDVRDEETVETEWGAEIHFVNAIVGGVIDMNKFFSSIQKGVLDAMQEGPVAGFPVGDIRVCIYDGGMHPVDSNEAAFKRAAYECFRNAFHDASPVLMEPIREVTVTTPDDYTGDVISDLNTRRGRIQGINTQGPLQQIKAEVPEAELHKYSTALRSVTHGRGLHMTRFSHYDVMPDNVQEEVVNDATAEAAA